MLHITRRKFITGLAGAAATFATTGAYAFGFEPRYRLRVQDYRLTPKDWTPGLKLKLAIIADLHASDPLMPMARVDEIVDTTNALGADVILLLGDYIASHRGITRKATVAEVAKALTRLKAPLGVHGVMGNHDWWDDLVAQRRMSGPTVTHTAFRNVGLPLLENDAIQLKKDGKAFWLAGLGDQIAFPFRSPKMGVHDMTKTLAAITDDAPAILMAHEPDIFARIPDRFGLTIAGHTHGGQVRIFGYSPMVPSRYGNRYAYGHVIENERHLIVSGGLGCSKLPLRFGVPPEIVVVNVGDDAATS